MAPPHKRPKLTPQQVRDQNQDARIADLSKDRKRMDTRATASLRLSMFQNHLLARAESWENAVKKIGSAYATAAGEHQKALA